jgi:hypothetical protein
VILPVFKTGARHLRGVVGVFDSHTLPPPLCLPVCEHGSSQPQDPYLIGCHSSILLPS